MSATEDSGAELTLGLRVRCLPIIGSSAVVLQASKRGDPKVSWLEQMLARKPSMLVTVALASKEAGIILALLVKQENYSMISVVPARRPDLRGTDWHRHSVENGDAPAPASGRNDFEAAIAGSETGIAISVARYRGRHSLPSIVDNWRPLRRKKKGTKGNAFSRLGARATPILFISSFSS